MSAIGALLGLIAAAGLMLIVAATRARRLSLDDRLSPYLRAPERGSRLLARTDARLRGPLATVERLLAPVMVDALELVTRHGTPGSQIGQRLTAAGRSGTVEQFRTSQVVGGAMGTAVGLAVAGLATASGRRDPLVLLAFVVIAAIVGFITPDVLLDRQVKARRALVLAELPTVIELLALAVAAGEAVPNALERLARTTHGVLSAELGRVVADVRTGMGLGGGLSAMADRLGAAPVRRLADAIAVAVDRGTPLGDVLRAQADDVRVQAQQALMETGGRKEVLMMVPVVFLLLPVTVLFVIFPSMIVLRMGW